jgi:hypothetical protein
VPCRTKPISAVALSISTNLKKPIYHTILSTLFTIVFTPCASCLQKLTVDDIKAGHDHQLAKRIKEKDARKQRRYTASSLPLRIANLTIGWPRCTNVQNFHENRRAWDFPPRASAPCLQRIVRRVGGHIGGPGRMDGAAESSPTTRVAGPNRIKTLQKHCSTSRL